MYKTRIVKIPNATDRGFAMGSPANGSHYYVEFKWGGNWLRGLLTGKVMTWTRFYDVPDMSLKEARATERKAINSYRLNLWRQTTV